MSAAWRRTALRWVLVDAVLSVPVFPGLAIAVLSAVAVMLVTWLVLRRLTGRTVTT